MQITDTKTLAALCQVGVEVIPTLAAAEYFRYFSPASDRAGINPAPTADVCNTLVINGLST